MLLQSLFAPGLTIWILTLASLTHAEIRPDHKCLNTKYVTIHDNSSCSRMSDAMTYGWMLDINATAINNGYNPTTQLDDVIRHLADKKIDQCYYSRSKPETTWECCEGYTGENCEIAECTEPCKNGGTCTTPNVCSCTDDTEGDYCEERKADVTTLLRYCYTSTSCVDEKVTDQVITIEDCWKKGGISWGKSWDTSDCKLAPSSNVTVYNPPPNSRRTCSTAGECGYTSWDGVSFTYCSTCQVTLFTSGTFSVVTMTQCELYNECKCNKIVTITDAETVWAYYKGNLTRNGVPDSGNSDITLSVTGESTYLSLIKKGFIGRMDSTGAFAMSFDYASPLLQGRIDGMCGNADGLQSGRYIFVYHS